MSNPRSNKLEKRKAITMMIPMQDRSARNNNSSSDIELSIQRCWDDECAAAFAAGERTKIQEEKQQQQHKLQKLDSS
jgi:hypothetical protein